MQGRYSEELIRAFVVGAPELKKLTKLLQDSVGKVRISAHCTDGFSYDFETIDELIGYENPKSKEIQSMNLTAESEDFSKSAKVHFSSSGLELISVRCHGDRDCVSKLKEKILDIIEGTCPWYNVIRRQNIILLTSGILLMLWFIWMLLFVLYHIVEFKSESISNFVLAVKDTNLFIRLLLPFMGVLLTIFIPNYGKLQDFVFPPGAFKIGQGKSRFKVKERIQSGIIGFLVSLATGLIIWLITR